MLLRRVLAIGLLASLQGCILGVITPEPPPPAPSEDSAVWGQPVTPQATRPAPVAREENEALKVLVSPSKPVMEPGESVSLTPEVRFADGQINGNVLWSSSDDTIATVNRSTGKVTALREGRVTIVAGYAQNPRIKGLAELTIVKDKQALAKAAAPEARTPRPAVPSHLVADHDEAAFEPSDDAPPASDGMGEVPSTGESGRDESSGSAPGVADAPVAGETTFSGSAGTLKVFGPVYLAAGIHAFQVRHETGSAPGGAFQLSLYTADGAVGDNVYSATGPLDLTFPYMVFNSGWYFLAVERASGNWRVSFQ
ncbi:MAG: Ig-like domain-containing protein [Candidatus Sericytochromatia bacterium]|nr:Ig-like domain-containing protein [Candidatus Sericytochromatia bacterium]